MKIPLLRLHYCCRCPTFWCLPALELNLWPNYHIWNTVSYSLQQTTHHAMTNNEFRKMRSANESRLMLSDCQTGCRRCLVQYLKMPLAL